MEWIDSRVIKAREHRNFIHSNTNTVSVLQGFRKRIQGRDDYYGTTDINYDELSEEDRKNARESANKGSADRTASRFYSFNDYSINQEFNYFVYLYDEFKITNLTPLASNIDFSRNNNYKAS